MICDNEAVYDERISPLMAQIVDICREHAIPMAAVFEYDEEAFCTTTLPHPDQSEHMKAVNRLLSRHIPTPPLTLRIQHGDGSQTIETIIG